MTKSFYITTTLPYVNAEPHIGFALEIVTADTIARYHRLSNKDVIFNTGTDEHGQKVYQKALEANLDPQKYTDKYATKFHQLKKLLNLSYTNFIRTTNPEHKKAAQKFWQLCEKNKDVYKKFYPVKYCIGCELEKTDSELENGRCPLHPHLDLEIRKEENYFFRFSKYQKPLLKFYQNNPKFVIPAAKQKEIFSFVSRGLQDFSISRLKEKMPWGIPVPGDPEQVMYVWFDALINYISTLGWPKNIDNFKKYWPVTQIAGKDNLRQQSAMWQAMLMSAGLPNSKQILINGFINVAGQKMSKSLGNVITPKQLVDRYGIDGTRFLLIHSGPLTEDIDVTWKKFDTLYTAHLSNGLGNLVSRVASMVDRSGLKVIPDKHYMFRHQVKSQIEAFRFDLALTEIWQKISDTDKLIEKQKPWELKPGQKLQDILQTLVAHVRQIAFELKPFLPDTADTIEKHFAGSKITKIQPLFPRLNN